MLQNLLPGVPQQAVVAPRYCCFVLAVVAMPCRGKGPSLVPAVKVACLAQVYYCAYILLLCIRLYTGHDPRPGVRVGRPGVGSGSFEISRSGRVGSADGCRVTRTRPDLTHEVRRLARPMMSSQPCTRRSGDSSGSHFLVRVLAVG